MVCNAWRVVCVCVAAQGPRSGWCVMFGVLCMCGCPGPQVRMGCNVWRVVYVWLSGAPGQDGV